MGTFTVFELTHNSLLDFWHTTNQGNTLLDS